MFETRKMLAIAVVALLGACADIAGDGTEPSAEDDAEIGSQTSAVVSSYRGNFLPVMSLANYLCMEVDDNLNLRMEVCNFQNPRQLFSLYQDATLRMGTYGATQWCVDTSGSFASGVGLSVRACSEAQLRFFPSSDGQFVALRPGFGTLCMATSGSSTDPRARLRACNTAGSVTRWRRGWAPLQLWAADTCVSTKDGVVPAQGVTAVAAPCSAAPVLQYQHNPGYITISTSNGQCLDVRNGGTANTTRVQFWSCIGSEAQKWVPQDNGSLRNPQSGKCLDLRYNDRTPGTEFQIYDCKVGEPAQLFVPGLW